MSVFIIAATTLDGFIGKDADHLADWTSKEDKQVFVELTKKAKVMVMGYNTFKTIGRALPGRKTIVYSHRDIEAEGVEVTQEKPAALIARLHAEGFEDIAICGGQQVYSMFLEEGVVDRLCITLEPRLFGSGLSLCKTPMDQKLQLKTSKQLNRDTLFLEYEVL